MAVKFFRIVSYVLMTLGGTLVLGSVEPEHMTPMWYVIAYVATGLTLIRFGWRMYVATEPRRIFLDRR